MDKIEKYDLKLFGQSFVLTTNDGDKNDLKIIVDYYKKTVERLIEKLPNRPQLEIAILAGLKITDKLYSIANTKNIKIDDNDIDDDNIHKIVTDAIKRLYNLLGFCYY